MRHNLKTDRPDTTHGTILSSGIQLAFENRSYVFIVKYFVKENKNKRCILKNRCVFR